MTIIAIVSQKGGSGKTTLSVNLAAAAEAAGAIALIIDTDPQATASQWGAWRADKAPEVIDSAPPRIQAKVEAAKAQGATFIVIDTPPHADSAASRAVEVADLVLIPCRPSAFDLAAIKTTVSLVHLFDKPAYVVFTAGPPYAPRMYEEAAELVQGFGIEACPLYCRIVRLIAMLALRVPRSSSSSPKARLPPRSTHFTRGPSRM